ncbi:SRPBCC family protein [Nitratireductor alexandrii]|uniref:SRPBCC family protein n=1 Tax=Nitratireductor alexandrii TaxID=2448161 RepID=UPI000FD8D24B|nr:SRPBCC family protein [Nitratireductor alexandrii]
MLKYGSERPDFDIETHWRLEARPEELTAIVLDPELIHRWCPAVFMGSELVARGGADGLGMAIRLYTKGFLPHAFFFVARIVDLVPHRSMTIAVSGDFDGAGFLTVEPGPGGICAASLRWRVRVAHPYVRRFVPVFRPVLAANHKWAARRAHRLLQEEVFRRRRLSNAFVEAKPTFPHNLAPFRAWQRRRAAHRGWRVSNME